MTSVWSRVITGLLLLAILAGFVVICIRVSFPREDTNGDGDINREDGRRDYTLDSDAKRSLILFTLVGVLVIGGIAILLRAYFQPWMNELILNWFYDEDERYE